jgi:hypothetical protein
VSFLYKAEYDDGSHLLQYGLIAEAVEKAYPEMVAYGADGQVMTVKYQILAPMPLNEAQKRYTTFRILRKRLSSSRMRTGSWKSACRSGSAVAEDTRSQALLPATRVDGGVETVESSAEICRNGRGVWE